MEVSICFVHHLSAKSAGDMARPAFAVAALRAARLVLGMCSVPGTCKYQQLKLVAIIGRWLEEARSFSTDAVSVSGSCTH